MQTTIESERVVGVPTRWAIKASYTVYYDSDNREEAGQAWVASLDRFVVAS